MYSSDTTLRRTTAAELRAAARAGVDGDHSAMERPGAPFIARSFLKKYTSENQ